MYILVNVTMSVVLFLQVCHYVPLATDNGTRVV